MSRGGPARRRPPVPMRRRAATVPPAVATVLLLAVLAITLAVPASATPGAPGGAPNAAQGGPDAARPGARATSPNWSGYIDDSPNGRRYTAVRASWVQPTVTCPTATVEPKVALWVGLDGNVNGSVEQDGTEAQCTAKGVVHYSTWWYMYPSKHAAGGPIEPGDHVTASVTYDDGTYTLTVTVADDPAASFTTEQTCGATTCPRTSAEWIAEDQCCAETPSGYYPLADFGHLEMSDAAVTSGGVTGVISTFPHVASDIVDPADSTTLAHAGALDPGGAGFRDSWVAVQ